MIATPRGHSSSITNIIISSNNKYLLSSSADGSCVLWDIMKCNILTEFPRIDISLGNDCLAMSSNADMIVTKRNGKLNIWNKSGNKIQTIDSDIGRVNCLRFINTSSGNYNNQDEGIFYK
mgnify:CR=1 FL=1